MSRCFLLAVLLTLAAAPAWAQTAPAHTFQIRNGEVYVDGQMVPDAIPAHLNLEGVGTNMIEIVGDVVPVLEVDGAPYVFENRKLVPLAESSRATQGNLYVMPEIRFDVSISQVDRMTPVVEGTYLRDVAARDQALYTRMQREQRMEIEAFSLADQIRTTAEGARRDSLTGELRGLLSELLSLKQEILHEEIQFVAARLDALRARLEEREDRHDEIVDHRLRQLVGEE